MNINIDIAKTIEGWMYEEELVQLGKWATQYPEIIEVGSWKGRSTAALCENTSGKVLAIDTWEGPKDIENWSYDYQEVINFGANYVLEIFKKNLKKYLDSGKLIYMQEESVLASKKLLRRTKKFDMVFIDANHGYEFVKADIIAYSKLLKSGGLLCGHDFNWNSVEKAVKELLPDYETIGNLWYKVI